jgi:hypothetical protein
MSKVIGLAVCVALAAASTGASAQFGGMPKLPGSGGGSSSAAAGDIDGYLIRSTETAQLMMSAITILDYAKTPNGDKAALKAKLTAINSKKDTKELNAYKAEIEPQTKALNDDANAAAAIQANYAKASAQEKALISAAVFNMLIAIPRAVKLGKDGPDLIKGLGSSPANLGKIGKIKGAVELFAYQVGATAKFAGTLPKLTSAVKVQAPGDPQTAKPQTTDL